MYHRYDQVIKDLLIYGDYPTFSWNYIAAIRGPDVDGDILKQMITAVVRGDTMENGSIGMPKADYNIDPESYFTNVLMANFRNRQPSCHFVDHGRWGLQAVAQWYHIQKDYEAEKLINELADSLCFITYRNDEEVVRKFVRCFFAVNSAWEGWSCDK